MANPEHTPVMVEEVCRYLGRREPGLLVDGTVGHGGHAAALLARSHPAVRLLGLDLDPDAVRAARRRLAPYGDRCQVTEASYAEMREVLTGRGLGRAHGILLDLGVSSSQIDRPERGFSYRQEGPLDMRMSRGRGETAGAFLATADEAELTRILATYGEEPRARRIARGIVRAREEAPLGTTSDLRRVVERSVPGRDVIPCLSRTFQALRIRVNRELENLDVFLETAPGLLAGRGVLCVISYHSLEDRRVKRAMRRWGRNCICPPGLPECRCGHEAEVEVLTRRVRVPSAEEVAANPRSRSARLRACRRL